MGTRDIDDDVILQAAELAGVSEIVKKHAVGYDLQVGEQGRNLSGGQRQCVALARAILLDPPLLVLDEPTSSMDNRTEQRIKDRLQKILEGKSLLLITHRASMLQLVDRIIVLDNGHIVADGSRDSVLEALRNGQLNL